MSAGFTNGTLSPTVSSQRGDSREAKKGKAKSERSPLISTKKLLPVFSSIVPVTLIGVNNVVLFSERQS